MVGGEGKIAIVYVVTSDGCDAFADMALVSMLSARVSNPGMRIVTVLDEKSGEALKAAKHRLLQICDEFVMVPTPDGEPTFRNRWIKTQLCSYVSGNVLYLDADTLVRGSLADLPLLVSELGAVANHNGATVSAQIWSDDQAVLDGMGWAGTFTIYVNGGFLLFKPCARVRELFSKWHELWLAGMLATGHLRDQPSLNSAIVLGGIDLKALPSGYNAQLAMSCHRISEAAVWHFYTSLGAAGTSFDRLVNAANDMSLDQLLRRISRVISAPTPWPNRDWIARHLAARVELRGSINREEWFWLNGRRKDAVRCCLGKARRGLAKRFRRLNVRATE